MKKSLGFLSVALLLMATSAMAQDDRYQLTAGSEVGPSTSSVTVAVTLDSVAGTAGAPLDLQGWSYGLCHDGTLLTLTSVLDGSTTVTVNAGGPPDFNALNDAPVPGDGFTVGVVIDFFGVEKLTPAVGYELNVMTYTIDAAPGGVATLDFCDTLATPAVETLVVEDGGASATPVQNSGTISAETPPENELAASDVTSAAGLASVAVSLTNAMDEVEGFSFGVTHTGNIADLLGGDEGSVTAATNGGDGADFFFVEIAPDLSGLPAGTEGGFVGCVISLAPPFGIIPAGTDQEIAVLNYQIDGTAVMGDNTVVDFSNDVGDPPVVVVLSIEGNSIIPSTVPGSITVGGGGPVNFDFIRGDFNDDGLIDVSDIAGLARALFAVPGAAPVTCEDAADANDNGALDMLQDPIYLITYVFQNGPAPAAPFPTCGPDGTDMDALGCLAAPSQCP